MKNWKSTSAGILAITSAVVTVAYAIYNKTFTPELITSAVTSILAGIGLIWAEDPTIEVK